jgi:purine-nucleoside phosphorylase
VNQELAQKTDRSGELVEMCLRRIRRSFGSELPKLGLVLGSGFEGVLAGFQIHTALDFHELPGFAQLRVEGHAGRLFLAQLAHLMVLVCSGRAHFYEGHEMDVVSFPIKVLAELGVKELLLTNAAGGINSSYRPGDFMLFSDHINFTGVNPLRGCERGSGFVDLTDAYSCRLRAELISAGRIARVRLHEGIYLGVSGPSYETPAEIRMFRQWGADAVGMSTIPEVLMARARGIEVAGISCITNYAAGMRQQKLSHAEVLANGRKSAETATRWFTAFAEARGRQHANIRVLQESGTIGKGTIPSGKPNRRAKKV